MRGGKNRYMDKSLFEVLPNSLKIRASMPLLRVLRMGRLLLTIREIVIIFVQFSYSSII